MTDISPGYEGSDRVPWMKDPQSSVPPEKEIWQTGPKASASHFARLGVNTAPLEKMVWSVVANDPRKKIRTCVCVEEKMY